MLVLPASQFDGMSSASPRQSPAWEKMLGTASRCDEGPLSSVMPWVPPEVIAM